MFPIIIVVDKVEGCSHAMTNCFIFTLMMTGALIIGKKFNLVTEKLVFIKLTCQTGTGCFQI